MSLIVPIFIKLFLNIGIIFDLVWDLFNMLQIVANVRNMANSDRPIKGMLVLPSCLIVLLNTINSIVYFKPFENELVKKQLYRIKNFDKIMKFIN